MQWYGDTTKGKLNIMGDTQFPLLDIYTYILCVHISLVLYFVADGGGSNQLGGNCV